MTRPDAHTSDPPPVQPQRDPDQPAGTGTTDPPARTATVLIASPHQRPASPARRCTARRNRSSSVGGCAISERTPNLVSRASTSFERGGVDVDGQVPVVPLQVVGTGQPAEDPRRPRRRRARPATTVVRVRLRSSSSEPLCTVLPPRMIVTRSAQDLHLGQDVAGQQHVRPSSAASRTTCWNTASISGSRPLTWVRPSGTARRPPRAQRRARPSAGCPSSTRGP